MEGQASVFSIALVHTLFNILSTVILIPFCSLIEKLAIATIKSKGEVETTKDDTLRVLDERFLAIPDFALEKAQEMLVEMIKIAIKSVNTSLDNLFSYDENTEKEVMAQEKLVDNYEDKLGAYLVKLAGHKLAEGQANDVTSLLHIIGDVERISDHACNLMDASKEIYTKKITFSDAALKEIGIVSEAIKEILEIAGKSVEFGKSEFAIKIEPLEQVIDMLKYRMKDKHIERLQNQECTIELGFVYSDIITNFERIADHCSNIGVSILQRDKGEFEPHEYLDHVKHDGENNFTSQYDAYKEKYYII